MNLRKLFQRQREIDRAFEERALEQLDRLISRAIEHDPFPLAHRADWEAAHHEPVSDPQVVLSIKFSSAEFDVLARVAEENETKVTKLAHDAIMDWLATTPDETVEMPPLEFAPEHPRLKFNVERSEWARLALIAENNGLPLEAQAHFALAEWLEWAEAELVRQPKHRAQPRPPGGHLPPEAGPPPTGPPPKPPPPRKTRKNP